MPLKRNNGLILDLFSWGPYCMGGISGVLNLHFDCEPPLVVVFNVIESRERILQPIHDWNPSPSTCSAARQPEVRQSPVLGKHVTIPLM